MLIDRIIRFNSVVDFLSIATTRVSLLGSLQRGFNSVVDFLSIATTAQLRV